MSTDCEIKGILEKFPKKRGEIDQKYLKSFYEYYTGNRNTATTTTKLSGILEGWMHRRIANTKNYCNKDSLRTLEIGAGTLNQLKYEKVGVGETYDIIEPNHEWVDGSCFKSKIHEAYEDIADVPFENKYDRITSCATFEHITNLPFVVAKAALLMESGGVLSVGIPNEGRFLWRFACKNTTGREFYRRYGLEYEIGMRYEHVNTADEIECILNYCFNDVKMKLFGINKDLAFYRYYECVRPHIENCEKVISEDL